MTRKTTIISSLAIVALLGMAALSFAGPGYGPGYGCGGPGYGKYNDLTPEKQAAMDKIVGKYRARMIELRDQVWAKSATLEAMTNAGNADEAKISKLVSDISELRGEMWENRDAMTAELEKETGIRAYGRGGRGGCGNGYYPGNGGRGPGFMHRW